jgi:hypothetical protein
MLWDRQILLPSIAQAVGGLNPSLPSIYAAAYIGSKGEILAKSRCFPLCPRERTQIGHRAMSERCHHQTVDTDEAKP